MPLAIAGFKDSKKRPTADLLNSEPGVLGTGCGDLRTLMCAGTSGIKEVKATPFTGLTAVEPSTLAIMASGSCSKTEPFEAPSLRVYWKPEVKAALLIAPL